MSSNGLETGLGLDITNDLIFPLHTNSSMTPDVALTPNKVNLVVDRLTFTAKCEKLLQKTIKALKVLTNVPDTINVQDYIATTFWIFQKQREVIEKSSNPIAYALSCLFLSGKSENVFFKAERFVLTKNNLNLFIPLFIFILCTLEY